MREDGLRVWRLLGESAPQLLCGDIRRAMASSPATSSEFVGAQAGGNNTDIPTANQTRVMIPESIVLQNIGS